MTLDIQLKRSAAKDSKPTAGQLKDGELGLNYNKDSLALYAKDSDGVIRQIAGGGSEGQYWEVDGNTLSPTSDAYSVDVGDGKVVLGADGNVNLDGKATSAATSPADSDTTLATKGYVDSQIGSSDDLQEVTNNGNFTTNDIDIGGTSGDPNIELKSDGSATFSGQIESESGGIKFPDGTTQTTAATGSGGVGTLQEVTDAGNTTTNKIEINGSGVAELLKLDAAGGFISFNDGATRTGYIQSDNSNNRFNFVAEDGNDIVLGVDGNQFCTTVDTVGLTITGEISNTGNTFLGGFAGTNATPGFGLYNNGGLVQSTDQTSSNVNVYNLIGPNSDLSSPLITFSATGSSKFAGQVISGTDSLRGSFKAWGDNNSGSGCILVQDYNTGNNYFKVSGDGSVYAQGIVESQSDGFKFPDGTIQTTAATGGGSVDSVTGGTNITVGGTAEDPVVNLDDSIALAGKATSDATVAGDSADTLTTKGYVEGLIPSGGVTQIVAGTNVTISPTGGTGVVTINADDQSGGVTSIIAGDGIEISGSTGDVTISADMSEIKHGIRSFVDDLANKYTFSRDGVDYPAPVFLPRGRGGMFCCAHGWAGNWRNSRSYLGTDGIFYFAGVNSTTKPNNNYYSNGLGDSTYEVNNRWRSPCFLMTPQQEYAIGGMPGYEKYVKGIKNTIDNRDTDDQVFMSAANVGIRLRDVYADVFTAIWLDETGMLWHTGDNRDFQAGANNTTQTYQPRMYVPATIPYTGTVETTYGGFTASTTTSDVGSTRVLFDGSIGDSGIRFDVTTDENGEISELTVVDNGDYLVRSGETVLINPADITGGSAGANVEVLVDWSNSITFTPDVTYFEMTGTNLPKFVQGGVQGDTCHGTTSDSCVHAVDEDGRVYSAGAGAEGLTGCNSTFKNRKLIQTPKSHFRINGPGTEKEIAMIFFSTTAKFALSRDGYVFAYGLDSQSMFGIGGPATTSGQTVLMPVCVNNNGQYNFPGFTPIATPAGTVNWTASTTYTDMSPDSETVSDGGEGILFDFETNGDAAPAVVNLVVSNNGNQRYRTGDSFVINGSRLGGTDGTDDLTITITDYNQLNGKVVVHVVTQSALRDTHFLTADGEVFACGRNRAWGACIGLPCSPGATTDPTVTSGLVDAQYIQWPRKLSMSGPGQANGSTAVYKDGAYQASSGNQRVVFIDKVGTTAGNTNTRTTYMITDGGEKTDGTPAQNWARGEYPRLYSFGYNAAGNALRDLSYRQVTGSASVVSTGLPDQEVNWILCNDEGGKTGALSDPANYLDIREDNPAGIGASAWTSLYTKEFFERYGDERFSQITSHGYTEIQRPTAVLMKSGRLFMGGNLKTTYQNPFSWINQTNTQSVNGNYNSNSYFLGVFPARTQPANFKKFAFGGVGKFDTYGAWIGVDFNGQPWYGIGTNAAESSGNSETIVATGSSGLKWDAAGKSSTFVNSNWSQDNVRRRAFQRGYLAQ